MRVMHPAEVIWYGGGQPAPNWQGKAQHDRPTPPTRPGVCALTGTPGPVVAGRYVLSGLFTKTDRFRCRDIDPAGLAFGPAACWAIRHRTAMQRPYALIAGTFAEVTTPAGLYAALTHLGPRDVVTVPQSRQKHLLPWAELGAVRTDDETLGWGAEQVRLLDVYATLRTLGFGETALCESAPRWPILTKVAAADQLHVLTLWPALDPWRCHIAYMDVAARATRKEKT